MARSLRYAGFADKTAKFTLYLSITLRFMSVNNGNILLIIMIAMSLSEYMLPAIKRWRTAYGSQFRRRYLLKRRK